MELLNLEQILKILGGVAALFGAGKWINHFFASGEVRLNDRRKDKDASQIKISELEKQILSLQRRHAYEVEVKHAALLQLNRLSWAYDSLRDRILVICRTLHKGEIVPATFLDDSCETPDAQAVLADVKEVIDGLHLAFSEQEKEEAK